MSCSESRIGPQVAFIFILLTLVGCSSAPLRITESTVIDIGTLPGGGGCSAWDINTGGDIVGYCTDASGNQRGVLFSMGTGMRDLGALPGGDKSSAYGVNNRQQVVGRSTVLNEVTGDLVSHGFVWQAGTMRDLGAFPPEDDLNSQSSASAINDAGKIAGYIDLAAVVWDPGGAPAFPPFPPTESARFDGEFRPASFSDINELGMAAGTQKTLERGFLMLRSETSYYSAIGTSRNRVNGIDPFGRAAGSANFREAGGAVTKAIYWEDLDSPIILGTLGGKNSAAMDTNEQQLVVGWSEDAAGNTVAFVWHEDFGMQPLESLGGGNSRAHAINDNGQIVGESETSDGEKRAVLWSMSYFRIMPIEPPEYVVPVD